MKGLKTFLKGLWVGSTMTVPGVSGGTMAVVIGVYEELIYAVNRLRKEPGKHILFLLQFVCGAAFGFFLLAGGISFLLENELTGECVRFFFCGAVAGGLPLLVKKSQVEKIRLRHFFSLAGGALAVMLLSVLPEDIFSAGSGIEFVIMQLAGGFVIAAALVLPGISASHMLYILGLYDVVLENVYSMRFIELFPLAAGGVIGVFLTSNMLERLIKRCTQETYLAITGFVAGSVISLIPRAPIEYPLPGAMLFILGSACMYMISRIAE